MVAYLRQRVVDVSARANSSARTHGVLELGIDGLHVSLGLRSLTVLLDSYGVRQRGVRDATARARGVLRRVLIFRPRGGGKVQPD